MLSVFLILVSEYFCLQAMTTICTHTEIKNRQSKVNCSYVADGEEEIEEHKKRAQARHTQKRESIKTVLKKKKLKIL